MTDLTLIAAPRISASLFGAILARNHSPAAAEAAELALIPDGYGIDRAIALAFFKHESTYGTVGVATHTHGWGNLRPASWQARRSGIYTSPVSGKFAQYTTWANSLHDWCELLRRFYIPQGLTTVRTVTPRYAPSSDGNNPQRYADDVIATVLRWQGDDQTPRSYRVRGLPIYQRQDLTGPLAGQLTTHTMVTVDATYPNGAGHLADGRGFVDLDGLEAA